MREILTRYGGSQSDEGNGVDAILEVDEASKMSSHVSDDGSTQTDGSNGNNECGITLSDSCKMLNVSVSKRLTT